MVYLSDDNDAIPYFDRKDGVPENGGDCTDPIIIEGTYQPFSDTNSTLGQGNDYFDTCMGYYDEGQDVIYKLIMFNDAQVKITLDAATGWGGVAIFDGCPGDPGTSCLAQATSASSPDVIEHLWLDFGTYYIMVDSWPPPETFSYTLTVKRDPPGDDCTDPWHLTIPLDLDSVYYVSTCGCGDTYNNTCLDEYDGGEDLIFEVTVDEDTCVDILLNSHNIHSGFAVFESCPADDPNDCLAVATGAAEDKWVKGLELSAGTYWIMVDGWPDPSCQDFFFHIAGCFEVNCPPGATDEGEPCGEHLNDGCFLGMPAFRPIANDENVCGTLYVKFGHDDEDWFQVDLDTPAPLTMTIESEIPLIAGLVELEVPGSGDCSGYMGHDPWILVDPMVPTSLTTPELPAGTHWLVVNPISGNGYPCGFHNSYVVKVTWLLTASTVDATLNCTPASGVVPFQTQMFVDLTNNYQLQIRRVAARINVELASGSSYLNWRAGFTNLQPGVTFTTGWRQLIPALGSVIGDNTFSLFAEDVTPPPYNQPPYAPSGDMATDACTVKGVMP